MRCYSVFFFAILIVIDNNHSEFHFSSFNLLSSIIQIISIPRRFWCDELSFSNWQSFEMEFNNFSRGGTVFNNSNLSAFSVLRLCKNERGQFDINILISCVNTVDLNIFHFRPLTRQICVASIHRSLVTLRIAIKINLKIWKSFHSK